MLRLEIKVRENSFLKIRRLGLPMSLSRYINLVQEMTLSDFKLRYQGSVLGLFWSLLKPLLMFAVLYLVFSKFVRFSIPHYQLYLLLGIILWNFFAETTNAAINGLISKSSLIKKVDFPRSAIVVSAALVSFLNLLFNLVVFFGFLIGGGVPLSLGMTLLFVPIFFLFLLSLGVGFFLAALNTRFKDVAHLWELLLQVGFWLTPVIYAVEMIPAHYHWLIAMNPMGQIIAYARGMVIAEGFLPGLGVGFLFLIVLVVFGGGYFVFRMREPYFAEEL